MSSILHHWTVHVLIFTEFASVKKLIYASSSPHIFPVCNIYYRNIIMLIFLEIKWVIRKSILLFLLMVGWIIVATYIHVLILALVKIGRRRLCKCDWMYRPWEGERLQGYPDGTSLIKRVLKSEEPFGEMWQWKQIREIPHCWF